LHVVGRLQERVKAGEFPQEAVTLATLGSQSVYSSGLVELPTASRRSASSSSRLIYSSPPGSPSSQTRSGSSLLRSLLDGEESRQSTHRSNTRSPNISPKTRKDKPVDFTQMTLRKNWLLPQLERPLDSQGRMEREDNERLENEERESQDEGDIDDSHPLTFPSSAPQLSAGPPGRLGHSATADLVPLRRVKVKDEWPLARTTGSVAVRRGQSFERDGEDRTVETVTASLPSAASAPTLGHTSPVSWDDKQASRVSNRKGKHLNDGSVSKRQTTGFFFPALLGAAPVLCLPQLRA